MFNVHSSASPVFANVSSSANEEPPSPGFGLAPTPLSGGRQRELPTNAYYITEASFATFMNLFAGFECIHI